MFNVECGETGGRLTFSIQHSTFRLSVRGTAPAIIHRILPRLDEPARATLEADVGLPLALQAARMVAAPTESALGLLLASNQ